jgi:uracil-DNA glycosylase
MVQKKEKWKQLIEEEQKKPYYKQLWNTVNECYKLTKCYPAKKDIFKAFEETPFEKVKVIIIGQDPYFDGNATGLAFECKEKLSPSLANINQSLKNGAFTYRTNLSLENWTKQGVFLLNSVLTVQEGEAHSHKDIGWQRFTGQMIYNLSIQESYKVFLLWGKEAQNMYNACANKSIFNCTIESEHPAYASYQRRAWNNNDCFNMTNVYLLNKGLTPIIWNR